MLDVDVNKYMLEFLGYSKFDRNKYYKTYIKLAEKIYNENRIYDSSVHEMHHVLPSSFGGVYCLPYTFREHYIAHVLLMKFTIGKDKMKMSFSLHTFFHFDNHRKLRIDQKSKLYVMHKRYFIEACKLRMPWTKKEVFHFKNMDTTDEFIGTRSEFAKYSGLRSAEIYNLLCENGLRHSKRWGVYVKDLNMFSYERVIKKGPDTRNTQCQHCGKICSIANYKRWHNTNCKTINPEKHELNIQQIKNLNLKSLSRS